jgi:plastocyanin
MARGLSRTRRVFRVSSDRNTRRIFCATFAMVTLGGLMVSGGGWPSGRAGAATTTCVWTKHTKRVVTRVRRHGKRTRVVHVKHYRTCRKVAVPSESPPTTPTITAPAPSPTPTPTPPPTEPPVVPTPEPEANAVRVTATETGNPYTYVPTRPTVHSGQLTVQLVNEGADPHDMYMQRVGPHGEPEEAEIKISTKTEPGGQETKSVVVQPGTYRMWCTFGNHAMEGMETHITVE